jgi:hypothetical protein
MSLLLPKPQKTSGDNCSPSYTQPRIQDYESEKLNQECIHASLLIKSTIMPYSNR